MPMLLQTFLQLNILILATPALAGWSLLPPAHPGLAHAAGIVWQYRASESRTPKALTLIQVRQAKLPAVATPRSAPAKLAVCAAAAPAALRICNSFPHAARAP